MVRRRRDGHGVRRLGDGKRQTTWLDAKRRAGIALKAVAGVIALAVVWEAANDPKRTFTIYVESPTQFYWMNSEPV